MDNNLRPNREEYLDEECSLCGHKLTLYGSKKLKDGVLCRTCAKIPSRWISEETLASMTMDDLRKHIEYRRANKKALESFSPAKRVDGRFKLIIDETNSNFIFTKRDEYIKENPDVISFDNIDEISIIEDDYLEEEGNDIYFEIKLKDFVFDQIRFRVNEFPGVTKDSDAYNKANNQAFAYLKALIEEEKIHVVDVIE